MLFGCLKGFAYFWGEIKNTKPIGSLPMGFVYVQSASLLSLVGLQRNQQRFLYVQRYNKYNQLQRKAVKKRF